MFTAWGIGGFVLPLTAGKLHDKFLTYEYAYYIAAVLLVLAAMVTFLVKPPKIAHHTEEK